MVARGLYIGCRKASFERVVCCEGLLLLRMRKPVVISVARCGCPKNIQGHG